MSSLGQVKQNRKVSVIGSSVVRDIISVTVERQSQRVQWKYLNSLFMKFSALTYCSEYTRSCVLQTISIRILFTEKTPNSKTVYVKPCTETTDFFTA